MGVQLTASGIQTLRLLTLQVVFTSATTLGGALAQAQPGGLTPCPKDAAPLTCSGTYRFPDGVIYAGEFREGRRDGIGAFVFPDGRRHLHEFDSDSVKGQGIRYLADGSIEVSGTFAYGQLVRAHPVDLQIFDRRAPIPSGQPTRPQLVAPQGLEISGSPQAIPAMTVDGRSLSFVLGTSSPSGAATGSISIFDIIDVNGRSSIKIIPRNPG